MSPLIQLTLARLREYVREPGTLFWVFGFPVLLALALGLAFQSGVQPRAPIVILPGPQQAERMTLLEAQPDFLVRTASLEEARQLLGTGRAFLAVGGDTPVRYLYDPTRPDAASLRLRVDEVLQTAAGRQNPLESVDDVVVAKGARYIDFLIPGLLGMNIMSASMWGIGWVIVQTRSRKLLKRLMATPMRKRDYLFSHILGRLIFLVLEVAVLLGFAVLVFDTVIQGNLLLIGLLSFLGAMTFAGIGLLVSSRARTAETVSGLMNAVMLPMFLLSGVFFSTENFPGWMQPFITLLPLTALNDALRAVINEGVGLFAVLSPMVILAGWAVLSFVVALKVFRWS
jgi:ABC-2 type transport system permease protein